MSDQILELLKQDMNGMTLDQIRKKIKGASLSDMKQLCEQGKVRFDPAPGGGLYKALPAAWN